MLLFMLLFFFLWTVLMMLFWLAEISHHTCYCLLVENIWRLYSKSVVFLPHRNDPKETDHLISLLLESPIMSISVAYICGWCFLSVMFLQVKFPQNKKCLPACQYNNVVMQDFYKGYYLWNIFTFYYIMMLHLGDH